jgi:hypothetical protein
MANLMAVISKAVFERDFRGAAVGDVLELDRYTSNNKAFEVLEEDDSKLFLVTVRPPKEALWLVAILENLDFDDDAWVGAPNRVKIRDISAIKSKIEFTSGTGIKAKKGALGMSLQTPRTLTDDGVALLEGSKKTSAKKEAPPKRAFVFKHVRSHDAKSLAKLDAVHQEQVIEALVQYAGTRWKTIEAALAGFEKAEGFSLAIDLWKVLDQKTKKPVYEYWVQGAGDGALFDYGTASCDNWLGSTQHTFESHGDQDEATLAIVDALQVAAEKAGAV